MRVSSPPFLWPCYFGTDVPARDQLIAYNRSVKEISDLIGTDSLDYLKIERLEELVGGKLGICKGCLMVTPLWNRLRKISAGTSTSRK